MDDNKIEENQNPNNEHAVPVNELPRQESTDAVLETEENASETTSLTSVETRRKTEGAPQDLAEEKIAAESAVERKPEPIGPKKKTSIVILLIAFLLLLSGAAAYFLFFNGAQYDNQGANPAAEVESEKKIELTINGNGLNDFDLSFLKLEEGSKNIVYSPLSIKYALSMLKDGTDGNSKRQLENILGTYHPKSYKNNENLSLANSLFVNNMHKDKIKEAYSKSLASNYGAEVIFDEFDGPSNINNWVSQKTFNQINDILKDVDKENKYFYLINALAIDMEWVNKLQTTNEDRVNGVSSNYVVSFKYEGFSNYVWDYESRNPITFNKSETGNTDAVQIAATANRYDIVKELGEDGIKSKVQEEYNNWATKRREELAEDSNTALCKNESQIQEAAPDLDDYFTTVSSHYGHISSSTDFYFNDNEKTKVFAKDLKTYDGTTLQYIGILPKKQTLSDYLENASAEDISNDINNLKGVELSSFKDGVITKLRANIPLFSFNYDLKFMNDLQSIGITDVFDRAEANLSNITDDGDVFITEAIHSANIDFSNSGIKAGAATVLGGGRGGGAGCNFLYNFEPPVEEIDLSFDNPYLFLIRDKDTGEIWFVGSVYEPNKFPE